MTSKNIGKIAAAFVIFALLISGAALTIKKHHSGKVLSSEASKSSEIFVEVKEPTTTKKFKAQINQQTSVSEIMLNLNSEKKILSTTKDYGEMGLLFESIDGFQNNAKKNIYWTLYINGKMSGTGASMTFVKPGDVISWHYESLK